MPKILESADLFYCQGSSDKEYHTQFIQDGVLYRVDFQYGRRGNALQSGTKITTQDRHAARKIYDKLVAEKTGKGYQLNTSSPTGTFTPATSQEPLFVPHLLMPIEDTEVEKYLKDDAYGAQEKMDGKHVTLDATGSELIVRNKLGKAIPRPEHLSIPHGYMLDCEQIGDTYHVFDLMSFRGQDRAFISNVDLRPKGYIERCKALEHIFSTLCRFALETIGSQFKIVPLYRGYEAKKTLYDRLKKEGREGIVFKKLDATYACGCRNTSMVKFKFTHTLTARVTQGKKAGKRSVGLELLHIENGAWTNVGNVTIPPNHEVPQSGYCEVRYLYGYKGGSLFQPVYLGPRDDVTDADCSITQVKYKAEEPAAKPASKSLFTQDIKVSKIKLL